HPIVTQRETDFFNNAETTPSAKKQNVRLLAANQYDYGFAQGQSTRTGYPSRKTGHYKTGKEHLYETARHASQQLKDAFRALQSEVEPSVAPDQELPEVDPEASLRLASLGVSLALAEKETIRLERELIASERECVMLVLYHLRRLTNDCETLDNDTILPETTCGDMKSEKKKMRLADPGPEVVHTGSTAQWGI
ncbi:hypothetical protein E4U44_008376, partial [Claviceps purpurea]